MLYIANGFSLNMLGLKKEQTLHLRPINVEEAATLLDEQTVVSAIPHLRVAQVINKEIGADLRASKINVALRPGDKLLVAQPEGDYKDPTINYWFIAVKTNAD